MSARSQGSPTPGLVYTGELFWNKVGCELKVLELFRSTSVHARGLFWSISPCRKAPSFPPQVLPGVLGCSAPWLGLEWNMHMGRVLGASCELRAPALTYLGDFITLAQTTSLLRVWGDILGVSPGLWLAWLGIRELTERLGILHCALRPAEQVPYQPATPVRWDGITVSCSPQLSGAENRLWALSLVLHRGAWGMELCKH